MIGPLDALPDPETPICSRAGCRRPATAKVIWRNPRIHAAERRKVWLACEEHREFLRDYLAARSFPVTVEPFAAITVPAPSEETR